MLRYSRRPKRDPAAGFTLVEIILTILIASILGVIAIQFTGTSLSMSAETVNQIHTGNQLNAVMEQITRDYRLWLEAHPGETMADFENAIKEKYPDHIDAAATGTDASFHLAAEDSTIDLLHVTLADGSRRLVALFTR